MGWCIMTFEKTTKKFKNRETGAVLTFIQETPETIHIISSIVGTSPNSQIYTTIEEAIKFYTDTSIKIFGVNDLIPVLVCPQCGEEKEKKIDHLYIEDINKCQGCTIGTIEEWPYPAVDNMFKAGDRSWREVSKNIYWEQLEALPPAKMNGNCFAVGEPWDHDNRGAIVTMFVQVGERYFCRMDHLIDFDPKIYRYLINRQLKEEKKNG
jgi:hypothetical protein